MLYTEDLPMDPGHHNAVPPMQGGFFMIKPGPESDKMYGVATSSFSALPALWDGHGIAICAHGYASVHCVLRRTLP
jgi:hypothetical protein